MTPDFQLLITIGSLAAMMWGMLKFMLRDIHKDLNHIRNDISELKQGLNRNDARIDHLYEENNRLYRTLIEMIKK